MLRVLLAFLLLFAGTLAGRGQTGAQNTPSAAVAVESYPGSDIGAKIQAADLGLGGSPGVITVNVPGDLKTPFTLHRGHDLLLRATVNWAVTVTLEGSNNVGCAKGATVRSALPGYEFSGQAGMLFVTKGGAQISVHDCHFEASAPSVVLAGYPVSNLTMTGNTLLGLSLLATNGATSTDLNIADNTIDYPASNGRNAGVLLFFAKRVRATGNRLTRNPHGIQWWGGNSGEPGANLKQVTAAGEMTFSGNICKAIGGACIWGSMGYDIQITGNTADGCGDVCFDTEGGLRTTIANNTATGCNNGCAAIFFFTDQTSITANHFSGMAPGGGLIFVKNASQNPIAHDHLSVTDNDLRCTPGVCHAMYSEAAAGVRFERNEVRNGTYVPVGYGARVSISRNHWVYTEALAAKAAAIVAPGMVGGTTLEVIGNRIESDVAEGEGSACIAAGWSDFNASDFHFITENVCGGSRPFPIDLILTTNGANPGPRAFWFVGGNGLRSGKVDHRSVTKNEQFVDLGECGSAGCGTAGVPAGTARATSKSAACDPGQAGAQRRSGPGSVDVCAPDLEGAWRWHGVRVGR